MDRTMNLMFAKGEDVTGDVVSCSYIPSHDKFHVVYKTGEEYNYNYENFEWLKDPYGLNPLSVRITHKGKLLFNIEAIYVFSAKFTSYYVIHFKGNKQTIYNQNELKVESSCLGDEKSGNCFEYFKRIAENTKLCYDKKDNNNQDEDNKTNKERKVILAETYKKIEFVGEYSALALYLNPDKYKPATYSKCNPIFPFGGNLSQFQAVRNALTNQISVIQGPPGTGKTQTILNIISNLLVQGKKRAGRFQ